MRVGERSAAYLCVSGPDEKTGPGALVAREIAGSRHAVLAAARAIMDTCQAESLDIEVPASDEAAVLAGAFGLESRTAGMHGTLKIIEPARFFQALGPRFVAAGLSGYGAPALASEDLAALVFGSVERGARGDDSLRRVFPLPLPTYGLNYV